MEVGNLYEAARFKDPLAVERFLQAGHDPDSRGDSNKTALMAAVRAPQHLYPGFEGRPKLDVVHSLLSAGADVNAKDDEGRTVLHHIFFSSNSSAGYNEREEIIETLIRSDAIVNSRDRFNNTPLMFAADQPKNLGSLCLLLKAGADVKTKNSDGQTALILAAQSDHDNTEIIQELLSSGSNINARDEWGMTSLGYACIGFPEKSVSNLMVLLIEGADPTIKPSRGPRNGVPLSQLDDCDERFKPILSIMEKKIMFLKRCVSYKGLQYACKQNICMSILKTNNIRRNNIRDLNLPLPSHMKHFLSIREEYEFCDDELDRIESEFGAVFLRRLIGN